MNLLSPLRKLIPVALLALATTAGVASAGVTIPNTALPLSATGEDVNDPQVAVGPDGEAFYAWVRDQPGAGTLKFIQAVRVSSTGTVGTVHTISTQTENASSPAIAASPNGTALVVWQETQPGDPDRIIRSTRINADGTLGTTVTMSNPFFDSIAPDVGIDADGDALVVYSGTFAGGSIEARSRLTSDVIGPFEDAANDGDVVDLEDPDVAVAPSGVAVLTFRRTGATNQIYFKRRLANGTWEPADPGAEVSGGGGDTKDSPQVAIDPAGDAVVTWREDVGSTNAILARRIESTETTTIAGVVKAISNASQNADQPQVDMDGDGDAYLAWRRSNGTVTVPQERTMAPDSTLGTTQNLNPTGTLNADQPQVAVDEAGNATFVWRFGTNIQSRGLTAAGALLDIQDLTTGGSNTEPRVDVNADGARSGAYRVDTAGNDQAFGFFDLTPPGFVPPVTPPVDPPAAGGSTPADPAPAIPKRCKKGQKLKKGKCVKKRRKKRR